MKKLITEDARRDLTGYVKINKPKAMGRQAGSVKDKNIGKLATIQKKVAQLKALMRPESKLFREFLPKTLEFGHEFFLTYTKHVSTGHLKDILYNPNIRSYVSYNEKHLHIWRGTDAQQVAKCDFFNETQSHSISCVVYSHSNMIYLAVSTDFKLHLFNEHLVWIGWFPLDVRLVHYLYFYEKKSTLITAGIDGCYMFHIHFMNKYEPKQAMILDPEGH